MDDSNDTSDDLRREYDLSSLKVRRVGKGRQDHSVQLDENDELLPHYDLDYSKSKPNRFAQAYKKGVTRRITGNEEGEHDESVAERETE